MTMTNRLLQVRTNGMARRVTEEALPCCERCTHLDAHPYRLFEIVHANICNACLTEYEIWIRSQDEYYELQHLELRIEANLACNTGKNIESSSPMADRLIKTKRKIEEGRVIFGYKISKFMGELTTKEEKSE